MVWKKVGGTYPGGDGERFTSLSVVVHEFLTSRVRQTINYSYCRELDNALY